MMDILRILLILALAIPPVAPAYAADGGDTTILTNGTVVETSTGTPTGETTTGGTGTGAGCDMQGFKNALARREASSPDNCTARRSGSQFMGKYQLGKRNALADIGWTDANGNWINGMTDQSFLADCNAQERAMDQWIVHMAGNIKAGKTGDGRMLTSFIGQPIPNCPDKKLTFSALLGGRHLCGMGWSAARATSGKCYTEGYTGLVAYFESGGSKDGQDGLGTRVSEYICTFNGYKTPYEEGGDFSSCGGSMGYGGTPGGSKIGFDPGGYYGDLWDPSPVVRHYNLLSDAILRIWVAGLAVMANQMVATMMAQAKIIGSFFDAKHQLETQRIVQQKAARAHKDYHPSEQMCTIGTFSRSLLDTERRANFTQATLAQRGIQRELMSGENLTVQANVSDRQSRFETFRTKFCNSKDNAGTLAAVCADDIKPEMINRDIDYTRTIDLPLTIAIDPLDDANAGDDGLAAHMLMDNLFQPHPAASIRQDITTLENFQDVYQDLRAIVAMRTVARNSMNNIIAQKSSGAETSGESTNTAFLRALIKDMGITDEDEITAILGERPSYYAQMELLTKKLYQHPGFVVNLYDKPANVARMRAAMRAIKVMQDRDIYDALARREMLLSMLAELSLRKEQGRVDTLVNSLRASAR